MQYFCKNMILRRSLLTYFLFSSYCNLLAQEAVYPIAQQTSFGFLWNPRFNGSRVNIHQQPGFRYIDFKATKWKNYPQQLIIENNRLYIHLLGSGIIYGSIRDEKGLIAMQRLDSTEHYGYNINSYSFSANKKLYNIGGYGMWRWNGQLRFFDEATRGWEIEPLSEEFPVSNEIPGLPLWISPDNQRLVSLGYLTGNQAIQGKENQHVKVVPEIIALDLKNFKWSRIGVMKASIQNWVKPELLITTLGDGLLFSNFGPLYLLDLKTFKARALKDKSFQYLLNSKLNPAVNWTKGNMIYFANFQADQLDSLEVKTTYFQDNGESVVEEANPIWYWVILFGLIPFLFFIFWLIWKRRRQMVIQSSAIKTFPHSANELSSPYDGIDIFDAVELSLLQLLIFNAKVMGKRTGTDEVNRVLGVSLKSQDMQKRKRSDVIKSINAKYKLTNPAVINPLIERVKSDMDARLFEYTLLQDEIENIAQFLKS